MADMADMVAMVVPIRPGQAKENRRWAYLINSWGKEAKGEVTRLWIDS